MGGAWEPRTARRLISKPLPTSHSRPEKALFQLGPWDVAWHAQFMVHV
jgi:hypothetical protein